MFVGVGPARVKDMFKQVGERGGSIPNGELMELVYSGDPSYLSLKKGGHS